MLNISRHLSTGTEKVSVLESEGTKRNHQVIFHFQVIFHRTLFKSCQLSKPNIKYYVASDQAECLVSLSAYSMLTAATTLLFTRQGLQGQRLPK